VPFERELRDLAHVPRWSIVRTLRTQSVAEHTFYVTLYADEVAELIKWEGPRTLLLRQSLWHDAEEAVTGDIVGPVKRNLCSKTHYYEFKWKIMGERFGYHRFVKTDPKTQQEIEAILKTANLLDETLYMAGELQMGNNAANAAYLQSRDRLFKSIPNLPAEELAQVSVAREFAIAIQRELGGSSELPRNDHDLREEPNGSGDSAKSTV